MAPSGAISYLLLTIAANLLYVAGVSRNSRRNILPTLVLGKSFLNSMYLGHL